MRLRQQNNRSMITLDPGLSSIKEHQSIFCSAFSLLPPLQPKYHIRTQPCDQKNGQECCSRHLKQQRVNALGPSKCPWKLGEVLRIKSTGWWYAYPSEKYESQLGWLFPIYGKIKNVPNHQPVLKIKSTLYQCSWYLQGFKSKNKDIRSVYEGCTIQV